MSRYFEEKQQASCKRCGQAGHSVRECKKDYLELSRCLLCAQTGHLVSDCPLKGRPTRSFRGHAFNVDRSEDGALCLVCGERDHVNCTFAVDETTPIVHSCAQCGLEGHNETKCYNSRRNNRHYDRRLSDSATDGSNWRRDQRRQSPPRRQSTGSNFRGQRGRLFSSDDRRSNNDRRGYDDQRNYEHHFDLEDFPTRRQQASLKKAPASNKKQRIW